MTIIDPVKKYKKLVPEIFEPVPKPPAHSQVLIIGSGFGGAITAYRLSQFGISSTILERGSAWPKDDKREIFTDEFLPDGRGFWHRKGVTQLSGLPAVFDKFGGVMDVTSYDNIDVWRGSCVGGGSVIYTGVMIQPEQKYFDELFQGTVDYKEMNDVHYPEVRRMLELDSMPKDIYDSKPFGHSQIWDQQAAKAGYKSYPVDSVFRWDVIRKELKKTVRPSVTVAESNLGNSNGAKLDMNQSYLKYAQMDGSAKVYPGHEVQRISHNGQCYAVEVTKLSPEGDILDRYTLTCDYLFLAAGSIGTSELLVKSKALRLLPNLNEHVGEGWGTNGDAIVVRSLALSKGLTQGAACASKIDDTTTSSMPVTMENWYAPGVPVNIGIIGSLGMAHDTRNRASFKYDAARDKVDLLWPKNGNKEAEAALRKVNNKIAKASLCLTGVPGIVADVNTGFTAHPLGGAVIGKATDAYGRVKGYDKLYVMDGALMPGSSGLVNPSLTIAALAERNILDIIKNDFGK